MVRRRMARLRLSHVRVLFALGVVTFAAAVALSACSGSSDSGLLLDGAVNTEAASADAPVADAAPDNSISPTCATIDASCLGVPVPPGWSLMDISEDAGTTCPGSAGEFEPYPLAANPRLRADSCTCAACAPSGAWSCDGKAQIGAGTAGTCTSDTAQFFGTPQCISMSVNAGLGCLLFQSAAVSATPPAVSGTPTCNAAFTGTRAADTDDALGCRPAQCTADYCGMRAHGFETCIVHEGDTSGVCPSGFHPAFGTSALGSSPEDIVITCDPCSCAVDKPGACTANVRIFGAGNGSTCDGDGGTNGADVKATTAADGTCKSTGICAFDGLYYAPDPPPSVSCTPSTPTETSGHASMVGTSTICCTP